MSDKEALLSNAREKGFYEALKTLIEGTEELLEEWKPEVGKNADRITYKLPKSNHAIVRYGGLSSSWHGLEADVYQGDNRFGGYFGVTEGEVITRLKEYLPHARDASETGYENRRADWVPIRNEADAEQFLAFLRSFLAKAET